MITTKLVTLATSNQLKVNCCKLIVSIAFLALCILYLNSLKLATALSSIDHQAKQSTRFWTQFLEISLDHPDIRDSDSILLHILLVIVSVLYNNNFSIKYIHLKSRF